MPNYYSEHYAPASSATVGPATSRSDPAIKAAPGKSHAKVYRKSARVDTTQITIATTEIVYLFPIKSGDMPFQLQVSSAGFTATALTGDLGLYGGPAESDIATVIDADVFGDAEDLDNVARNDAFISGVADDIDRNQPFWFIANEGAGTYTTDPFEDWHLTLTFDTVNTVTVNGIILVELDYVSAGVN